MLGSIAFNYWMAIAVHRAQGTPAARHRLSLAVVVDLAVLGVFKYANFFADNVNALLLTIGVRPVVVPRVLLPIGISFFTFHAISYVVDVHRRDATAQKSPVQPRSTSCSFRSSLPDRSFATATSRTTRAASRDAGRLRRRRAAVRHRAFQEGADCQRRRRASGPDLRHAVRRAVPGARLARRRLLHAADLLRFLRLLRHGDWSRPDVRLPLPGEFPVAIRRRQRAGVLAPLAHLAVNLVPRLPVHPARRQPRERDAPLREPGHCLFSVRPLARSELELRHLGAVARIVPRPRTCHVRAHLAALPLARAFARGRSGGMPTRLSSS